MVLPIIAKMPIHLNVPISGARSQDEFLDWAEKHHDNAVAADARNAFVLTLSALFERHLRRWLSRFEVVKAETMQFEAALDLGLEKLPVDADRSGLRSRLSEMVLVGNVMRHGNGRSVRILRERSPDLWYDADDHEFLDKVGLYPELMRISQDRVQGYADAILEFWGSADTLPDAVRTIDF